MAGRCRRRPRRPGKTLSGIPAWATIEMSSKNEVLATFDNPQRRHPGQSAVFYDGDEVVGGGWIIWPN
ncbi:MAG: aminomethyltransferase beta-barrel domain-containing protein [Alloacidobacterium sp.]